MNEELSLSSAPPHPPVGGEGSFHLFHGPVLFTVRGRVTRHEKTSIRVLCDAGDLAAARVKRKEAEAAYATSASTVATYNNLLALAIAEFRLADAERLGEGAPEGQTIRYNVGVMAWIRGDMRRATEWLRTCLQLRAARVQLAWLHTLYGTDASTLNSLGIRPEDMPPDPTKLDGWTVRVDPPLNVWCRWMTSEHPSPILLAQVRQEGEVMDNDAVRNQRRDREPSVSGLCAFPPSVVQ